MFRPKVCLRQFRLSFFVCLEKCGLQIAKKNYKGVLGGAGTKGGFQRPQVGLGISLGPTIMRMEVFPYLENGIPEYIKRYIVLTNKDPDPEIKGRKKADFL